LDWIVLKCLEKDRTRRYVTANGLAMDIQRYLNEEAVLARPPSQLYRLQKLVRRNRVVFLFGAAAAAALLLATIVSTILFVKEREARSSEAQLRRAAELREQASHVALLVTQRRFEQADKLSADLPLDKASVEVAAELRALGDWHATNGRWPEAAARFGSVVKVDQLDALDLISEDQSKLVAAFLKSGNRQGYEQFRQTEIAKLGLTNIASEYWIFKVGLLLPPDPNMLHLFAHGAELVEKRFPTAKEMRPFPPYAAQWSEGISLVKYRQGHFSEALAWGNRSRSSQWGDTARRSTASLIIAMSSWRMGGYQAGLVDWTEAYELIQSKSQQGLDIGSARSALFPGPPAPDDLEGSWYDWVIADLLLRECDELIAQSDHSLDSMSTSSDVSKDTAVSLARALGEWHAIRGEWEQAHNRFEYVHRLSQLHEGGQAVDYLHTALASLELGDESGFSRLRDETLHRFNGTTDPSSAEYVMKVSLLRPVTDTSAAALEPFVQVLLQHAMASAGPNQEGVQPPSSVWNAMLLGLYEYRRGNYAKAVDLCRRSLETCTYVANPTMQDHVILAMSFHKLGDDAGARSELDEARVLVQRGLNKGFDSWHWREWAFARLLLQEAEGFIPQASLPESPK